MLNNLKVVCLLLLKTALVLYNTPCLAQKAPKKFGDIDIESLKNNICPIDSNAHVYTVFEYGEVYFDWQTYSGSGVSLIKKKHFRMKFNDSKGLDYGDIEIPLIITSSSKEKVVALKAQTYNMDGDKIVVSKLKKEDILTENTHENITIKKFAMPNVRKGAIIEVSYTIKSDFVFGLTPWLFQKEIPVLHSEYHVYIPEFFHYNQNLLGYFPVETTHEMQNNRITLLLRGENASINYATNIYHYKAKNILPFLETSFLHTPKNYLSRVEYELAYTDFPGSSVRHYSTTWEKVSKKLNDSKRFGKAITNAPHIAISALLLKSDSTNNENNDLQLLNSAFKHIQNKIEWNGRTSIYTRKSLATAYLKEEGNSADINLNLVALLRQLGFKAFPVALSTQRNGYIPITHPSLQSLNHVIALARIDGKNYLMDASDSLSEINTLPKRCLNDQGRVIYPHGGDWVNLMNLDSFQESSQFNISINTDLSVKGTVSQKLKGHARYIARRIAGKDREWEKYIKKNHPESEISDLEVSNKGTSTSLKYSFLTENSGEQIHDMLLISPVKNAIIEENPFKLEERKYPIEFDYPYKLRQIYIIDLPEGYQVEEIPKPIVMVLPNKAGRFIYHIQQNANNVNITLSFSVNKEQFLPEEYGSLKQFYQTIIDKQNELIVLKKLVK